MIAGRLWRPLEQLVEIETGRKLGVIEPHAVHVVARVYVLAAECMLELVGALFDPECTLGQVEQHWRDYVFNLEAFDRQLAKLQEAAMLEPKVTEREIHIDLTEDEITERRERFEHAWEREQVVKAEKLTANQGFNGELKELRALQKALHDAFTSGKETRTIEVYERRDERRGHVEIVDKASGKVIEERPMTGDERQAKLFSDDGKTVKAKANGKPNGKGGQERPTLAKEPLAASVAEHDQAKRAKAEAELVAATKAASNGAPRKKKKVKRAKRELGAGV